MATPPLDRQHPLLRAAPGLLLALVAGYLVLRNFGVHPVIFADEWYYSKMARLQPLAEAIVPSYLYLWLFGASSACGDGFLNCVRAGNIAFYLAGTPFLYLTARRFIARRWAAIIALMSMLAPLNLFTLFFMPEATYYFGFCVLSWVLLAWSGRSLWHVAALAGVMLGAMSLVKVHALFLIPSLCLYLIYAAWHSGGSWLARGLGAAVLATALTLGIKFALGFLLAGDAGLSLLGPFYASSAGGGGDSAARLAATLVSAQGHLMALAVLLGLPLAILLHGLLGDALRRGGAPINLLLVYVVLMLGAGAGMTAVYAGTVVHVGNNEGLRLHMRYYSFTFPLLWIVAAAAMGDGRAGPDANAARDQRPWLRWTVAALVALLLAAAAVALPGYVLNLVDGPDIAAIRPGRATGYLILALQLAVLLLWAARRHNAPRLFMLVVLPLTLIMAQGASVVFSLHYRADRAGDRGGMLARQIVPANERSQITVVGAEPQQLLRAQFHIDDKDSGMRELAPGAPIESYQLPARQKWLLVIGAHALPDGLGPLRSGDGFALVRLAGDFRPLGSAHLSQPVGPDSLIVRTEGLSGAEAWGRWSDARQVVLHFAQPLPEHLDIILKGRAFADNTTLPFTLRVGTASTRFRLSGGDQEVRLRLTTDGAQRSMTIDVPRPTAPSSLGPSGDERQLGIGIAEIAIGADQPVAPATALP